MADPVNFIEIGPSAVPALNVFSENQRFKVEASLRDAERRSAEKQASERNKLETQTAEKELATRESIAAQKAATDIRVQQMQGEGFDRLNQARADLQKSSEKFRAGQADEERTFEEERDKATRKREDDLTKRRGIAALELAAARREDLVTATELTKKGVDKRNEIRKKRLDVDRELAMAIALERYDKDPTILDSLVEQVAATATADAALALETVNEVVVGVGEGLTSEGVEQPAAFTLRGFGKDPDEMSSLAFNDHNRLITRIVEATPALSDKHRLTLMHAVNAVLSRRPDANVEQHLTALDSTLGALVKGGSPNTLYATFDSLASALEKQLTASRQVLGRFEAGLPLVSAEGQVVLAGSSRVSAVERQVSMLELVSRAARLVVDSLEDRNIAPGKAHDADPKAIASALMIVTHPILRSILDGGTFTADDERTVREAVETSFDLSDETEKSMSDLIVAKFRNLASSTARVDTLQRDLSRLKGELEGIDEQAKLEAAETPSAVLDAILGMSPEDVGALIESGDLGGF